MKYFSEVFFFFGHQNKVAKNTSPVDRIPRVKSWPQHLVIYLGQVASFSVL